MSHRTNTLANQTSLSLETADYRAPNRPPPTRAGCEAIERPCMRTACTHNNLRDDEPEGRPSDGRDGRRMPVRLKQWQPGMESCALDVTQVHPDGLSRKYVGQIVGVDAPRVRQIDQRAEAKAAVAARLLEVLEAFRGTLPEGVELTVDPVRHGATRSVAVVLTIDETQSTGILQRLGVTKRKRSERQSVSRSLVRTR